MSKGKEKEKERISDGDSVIEESEGPTQRTDGGNANTATSSRHKTSGSQGLMRLNVIDKESGVCLYERVWKWKRSVGAGTSVRTGVCNLILTFLAMKASLNDAGESAKYVIFKQAKGGGKKSERRNAQSAVVSGAFSSTHQIRLVFIEKWGVLAALFHDASMDWELVQTFLEKTLSGFCEKYEGEVDPLREDLEAIAAEEDKPGASAGHRTQEEIIQIFIGFDSFVSSLALDHFV